MKVKYRINGKEVSRKEFEKYELPVEKGIPNVSKAWSKPLHCEAMGVNPEEVPAAREYDRRLGLGDVEYDRHGCPVFHSRSKYNEYLRAHGMHHRNAGYGDVAPRYK